MGWTCGINVLAWLSGPVDIAIHVKQIVLDIVMLSTDNKA